jgi:prepilin-type N-terminal cleavage/methylation domain-containing protein
MTQNKGFTSPLKFRLFPRLSGNKVDKRVYKYAPRDLLLQGSAGFTIIEMLVVIAIISMIGSLIFAQMTIARARARDAQRESEIKSQYSTYRHTFCFVMVFHSRYPSHIYHY